MMNSRTVFLFVYLALAMHAQAQQNGERYPTAFIVTQSSWWSADGLPASDVVAHDTTVVFTPDPARGWPTSGTVPVSFSSDPGRRLNASMIVGERTGVSELLTNAEEASCDFRFGGGPTSAIHAFIAALITPVDEGGEDERPLANFALGACSDTVHAQLTRGFTEYRRDSSETRSGFVFVSGSIIADWHVESNLQPPNGIAVHSELSGHIDGRTKLTDKNVLDSLNLDGRFRGLMEFERPGGGTDTIYGTWRVELEGHWGEDPQHFRDRLFNYFTVHGRYPDWYEEPVDSIPYADLLAIADTNSTLAIDSLVKLRVFTSDPRERGRLDAAIESFAFESNLAQHLLTQPQRVAPHALLGSVRYRMPHDSALGLDVANYVVRELAPLQTLRRRLVDREELGAAMIEALSRIGGFVPGAGPVFERAALASDDTVLRDLLWLAAYQSDPARYAESARQRVDSTTGYGPIVLAWLDGSGELSTWSYGVQDDWSVTPFPGVDAAPEALEEFLEATRCCGTELRPLQMRFISEGRNLVEELKRRFSSDSSTDARNVIASYLQVVNDTTAYSWLREQLNGPDRQRELAQQLLPRDSVVDTETVASIQRLLIGYIAGQETIVDTLGNAIDEPWVHDERPDLRIIISDNLIDSAIDPWEDLFDVMTRDSVESRVENDGLQMAWVIGTVRKTGNRYYVGLSLNPIGMGCLCGGGVGLELEWRAGHWVAVSHSMWIS